MGPTIIFLGTENRDCILKPQAALTICFPFSHSCRGWLIDGLIPDLPMVSMRSGPIGLDSSPMVTAGLATASSLQAYLRTRKAEMPDLAFMLQARYWVGQKVPSVLK